METEVNADSSGKALKFRVNLRLENQGFGVKFRRSENPASG